MRSRGLLLLAAVALLWGKANAAATADCSSCTAARRLHCGADGVTYGNRCLARCQGVRVARRGECSQEDAARAMRTAVAKAATDSALLVAARSVGGPAAALRGSVAASAADAPDALATISRVAMHRYREEGFNLIGLAKEEAFTPLYVTEERRDNGSSTVYEAPAVPQGATPHAPPAAVAAPATDPSVAAPEATVVGASAVRKSHDGFLYQLSPDAASDELRAALVAAAAAVAGKVAAATAAVSAVLGAETPSFVPGGGAAPGSQLASKRASLAASLLASLGVAAGGAGAGGSSGNASAPGGRRRLAHIIGADDRVEESDYPGWPYTAVGQVLFSQGSCSGVMIGPRSVLTAGHCVYSRKRKAWQDRITFTPYRHRVGSKDTWPVGRVSYTHATTYQGFMEAADYNNALNYDLAVIQLAEDVGYKTGWLGMSWDPKGFKGVVYTAGYPGDKVFGSLWTTSCRVTDAKGTDTRFVTFCDVYPGQSGSPIWVKPDNFTYELRAVMTYESCRCCSKDCTCCNGKFNGGNAINAMHYASIQAWK